MTVTSRRGRLGLLLVCAGVLWVLGALFAPAAAAQCQPAGGQRDLIDRVQPDSGDIRISGHGWGHGVGMSQYGAQGAARLGCSPEEILEHYYQGARVVDFDASSGVIDVGLLPDRPLSSGGQRPTQVDVHAAGDVTWKVDGNAGDDVIQPADRTWRVRVDGSRLRLVDHRGDPRKDVPADATLRLRHGDTVVHLPAKSLRAEERERWPEGRPYRDGELRFRQRGDGMTVVARIASIERYLRNVREIPTSWPDEALDAQVIAARSFALVQRGVDRKPDCDCHVYDSTSSQVWYGYAFEAQAPRWVEAVERTAGRVLSYDGSVVSGNYASSHGGHSESSAFVWGGEVPYLTAVDDSRWDRESDNPNRSWAATFSAAEFSERLERAGLGVGAVREMRTPEPRGASGRIGSPARGAGGLEVVGSTGRRVLSGDQARAALGLRSTLFEIADDLDADLCLPPADTPEPTRVERLAGPDRVTTAAAVAETFGAADTVVLASSGQFPDALSGGALAAQLGAPVLLTPQGRLHDAVAEAISDLGAERVVLLGGEAALDEGVESAAGELPGVTTVDRLAGADRFATAAAISEALDGPGDGEVVLALGEHEDPDRAWPDAVAAGALLATGDARPLLLTRGDGLPTETAEALEELAAERVLIVGGSAAVSSDVEDAVEALGYDVERLGGSDRWGTSVAVLAAALARGLDTDEAIFATGGAFPDALSAGALAAERGSPVLLAPTCGLARAASLESFLEGDRALTHGVLIGGTAALSPLTAHQLDVLLEP